MGCRRARPADELVRIARRPDGTLAPGRTLPGRGAWLCLDSPGCLESAARRGGFARAFRTAIPAEAIAALRGDLAGGPAPEPGRFVPDHPPARD